MKIKINITSNKEKAVLLIGTPLGETMDNIEYLFNMLPESIERENNNFYLHIEKHHGSTIIAYNRYDKGEFSFNLYMVRESKLFDALIAMLNKLKCDGII